MVNEYGLLPVGTMGRNASLSSAVTIPTTGATVIDIQPLTQDIWVTVDGTDPTATNGFKVFKDSIQRFDISAGVTIKVLEVTASAEIRYQLYNKVVTSKTRGL